MNSNNLRRSSHQAHPIWSARFVLLLAINFAVVSLISGVDFTLEQFAKFWYFFVSLALDSQSGGLYTCLRQLVGQHVHQARW